MRSCAIAIGVAAAASLAQLAAADKPPADLTAVPPVRTTYVPKRTAWGDPDFSATWTSDNFSNVGVYFERPKEQGNRLWLTDAEFAKRLAEARKSDADKTDFGAHFMPETAVRVNFP